MKKYLLLLVLLSNVALAQTKIKGIVLDQTTNEPLPFATVMTNTHFGTLTDVDGKFEIEASRNFSSVRISYVGYETVEKSVTKNNEYIRVLLNPSVENLKEVVIIGTENPALRIIRNAIKNRSDNNIEKALNSFKFNAYNKIMVTAHPDSISGTIDSVFVIKNGKRTFKNLDSSDYKFKREIEKQHLYITEKISEFVFQRGKKKKEVVLASRMAGLKQPLYEVLAITFQDFSFYNQTYTLAGTKYTNPIASNALKHYNYKILDTVPTSSGASFLVHFKPKVKKEYLGIEGVLYLDTKSFAITKAIAELKGIINVKASQEFDYWTEQDIWFPKTMQIVLRKGQTTDNIRLFGLPIQVNVSNRKDSIASRNKKDASDFTYFISKTVNSNIEINVPVHVKQSAATLQFNDDVHKKNEEFWNQYRSEPLSKRGERTYTFIDSIAAEENIEKKIALGRNILKGYYPTKYVNLNLGKIINLNNYEGLRVGLGGETNTEFHPKIKLDAYVAYGTKDRDFKFSYGASYRLFKNTNTWFGANYTNDLSEAAALNFIKNNTSFSPVNPRNLNISKFYNYKTFNAYLLHDIQPNLESKFQFTTGDFTPVFEYEYDSGEKQLSNFKLTMATIGIQYNPGNEYMNSPVGKLRTKNEFPQFTFQITKSFESENNGDFDFTQFNMRVMHKIKRLRRATTHFVLEGGIVTGEAPITHLFNATPNYTFKHPWIKRVTFGGKFSFETMGYNEFISDRFAALHIKHELKPFKISKRFNPQLSFAIRGAYGEIGNPEFHKGLDIRSMSEGYYEGGIEFNSLFKGFGLSSFYRLGAYQYDEWSDNLALKLTYKINLGF